MPQIVQQGAINTTALVVPDLYVQIVPPQNLVLNGVPTNVVGFVGSASWGPVNQATIGGSMSDYAGKFGPIMNRSYDMGTQVATAVQQGAQNFRFVRVTDGTDTAASGKVNHITIGVATVAVTAGGTGYTPGTQTATFSGGTGVQATGTATVSSGGVITAITVLTPGNYSVAPTTVTVANGSSATFTITTNPMSSVTFTAAYTGTAANSMAVSLSAGAAAYSWTLTVSMPGLPSEIYPNIPVPGGASPTSAQLLAFWQAVAAAVNSGSGVLRGPSQFVTASNGIYTNNIAPAAVSVTMSGGTDGASGVTASTVIGSDTSPRTGMYCLRGQGCSIAVLATADDTGANNSATWTTQQSFGLSEGVYMICAGVAGAAITNGSTGDIDLAQSTGVLGPAYSVKLMHGDWCYWNDPVNAVTRLVSPQGFVAGRLANLSPEQSSLNKPLYGIIGTQKSGLPGSGQMGLYAPADLQVLFAAGIDVIANPQPGGSYWGVRLGHNCSSNPAVSGDNYTRMTNYIAATMAAGMGQYVGQVINTSLFKRIRTTLLSFFQNMLQQGMLGSLTGSLPYGVICDTSNNPFSRTSIGYVQADCQVNYMAINEKFLVNIEGGQTVQVSKQTTPAGQIGS